MLPGVLGNGKGLATNFGGIESEEDPAREEGAVRGKGHDILLT